MPSNNLGDTVMGPDELPPRIPLEEEVEEVEEVESLPVTPEPVQPVKCDPNVTTVKDMVSRIHTKIDEFENEIDEEFINEMEAQLKAKKNGEGYFICRNRYWDLYLQKLFAQAISVKLWIIALITILLSTALITNIQFASILGVIMALKGSFQVAAVWKKNGNGAYNAMDKT